MNLTTGGKTLMKLKEEKAKNREFHTLSELFKSAVFCFPNSKIQQRVKTQNHCIVVHPHLQEVLIKN